MPVTRVEVTPRQGEGMRDVRGDVVRRQLKADHGVEVNMVRSICGYLIHGETPHETIAERVDDLFACLLYTSPSPRDGLLSRMPSSA